MVAVMHNRMTAAPFFLLHFLVQPCSAHRQYVNQIPNGDAFMPVWKAVGRALIFKDERGRSSFFYSDLRVRLADISPLPQAIGTPRGMAIANVRFPRNPFGHDFRRAGFRWTVELCRMDSDGDGLSNGEELGDPHCVWRFGNGVRPTISNATRLSHPGVAGEAGRFTSLVTNARTLDCVLGRGCKTLGTAPGIPTGTMQTRYTAPGAPIAYYHYFFVPVMLSLALLTYLYVPYAPSPRWPIVFVEVYLVCHVGVFLGCHRWASHHAFVATPALKWIFSVLASWCLQGTPAHWAFLHRLHHRFCDQGILDLQAPRPPHYFKYGHYSWFTTPVEHFYMSSRVNSEAIISDLIHDETLPSIGKDVGAAIICHVTILAWIVICYFALELNRSFQQREGMVTPCKSGSGGNGSVVKHHRSSNHQHNYSSSHMRSPLREIVRSESSFLNAFLQTVVKTWIIANWYFWLPCAIAFQCVLLVIDAVHMYGDLAFEDAMSSPCEARNNAFLILPLLGENWHNNHHSTPHSASTWVWWYQVDVQFMVARLLELIGLCSDVVVAPPSKLRDGYVAEGVFEAALAEWVALAAVIATPWWGDKLVGYLGLKKWWSARRKARDDGYVVVPTKAY